MPATYFYINDSGANTWRIGVNDGGVLSSDSVAVQTPVAIDLSAGATSWRVEVGNDGRLDTASETFNSDYPTFLTLQSSGGCFYQLSVGSNGILNTTQVYSQSLSVAGQIASAAALGLASILLSISLTYYVAITGHDDTGDGSNGNPWKTIVYASTQASPGDTIRVKDGTYTNTGTSLYASGTAGARITYVSNTKWGAHLISTSGSTLANHGDYVDIVDFEVEGSGINGIYTSGDHTRIIGNHVHDCRTQVCDSTGGSGINVNGTNCEVIGNYVHHCGPPGCGYVHGIYFLKDTGLAANNISFKNGGFGIQLWHDPKNITIVNNTIFNNDTGGIVIGNNVSSADYCTVRNNIIAYNGYGLDEESNTGIHNIYDHNLMYGNTSFAFRLQNGLVATGTVSADPLFVNYTGDTDGDYHLQAGSPARNAGTSSNAPSTDYEGNSRPQESYYDIGALEYFAGDQTLSAVGGIASREAVAPVKLNQNLTAFGVASALEAFGPLRLSHNITSGGGIASAGAFGVAALRQRISAVGGIASAGAFGTATIQLSVPVEIFHAGEIPSAEAFGADKLNLSLGGASGIAAGEGYGEPTLSRGVTSQKISTAGDIASGETLGRTAFIHGQALLGVGAIPTSESWGTAQLRSRVVMSPHRVFKTISREESGSKQGEFKIFQAGPRKELSSKKMATKIFKTGPRPRGGA